MFKILLIGILALYSIYKFSGFLTRIIGFGSANSRQPPINGEVKVDKNPNENGKFEGGEYVDFEEVK